MKGLELPINVLILVAVAVIVLLAMVSLYFIGWNPLQSTVGLESVKSEACAALVRRNCGGTAAGIDASIVDVFKNFDADQDGFIDLQETGSGWTWDSDLCGNGTVRAGGDNLASLCECIYDRKNEPSCKQLCGCVTV